MILIHTSLMTNVVEHFSSVHWSLIYGLFFFEVFKSFAHFSI